MRTCDLCGKDATVTVIFTARCLDVAEPETFLVDFCKDHDFIPRTISGFRDNVIDGARREAVAKGWLPPEVATAASAR